MNATPTDSGHIDTEEPLRGTVLLVEDDELVRRAIAMSLHRERYEVVLAKALDEALPAFEANPIDVVVTDLVMPGGSGLDLLRKIEEKNPHVPVIIITADQSVEAAAEAVRERAFDYLTKPVSLQVLLGTVARALTRRQQTKQSQDEQERFEVEFRRVKIRAQRTATLLSVLYNQAVEGIVVLDRTGRLVDASESFVSLVGKNLYELFDVNARDLFERHPTEGDIQDRIVALAESAPREGHWRGEVTVRAAEGRRLPAKMSLSVCDTPNVGADEEQSRYVIALLYYETAHEELSRQLQQADRLATIGLLAGSAAHEIKNELGPLIGYLSMIEKAVSKPVEPAMIQIMRESVRRVHAHVEQILEPLRPRVRTRGAVVLADRIDNILALLKRAGRLRRLDLIVEGPEDVVVHADKDEIHQIALNLISNAVDALGDGNGGFRGSIWVRTYYDGDYGVLEVEDNGTGIAEHVRARVFEPFFTTKGASGTGLGLPVVYDIVRSLRGRVSLGPGRDHGTIVNVWIPRYRAKVESADDEARDPCPPPANPR